jgi:hypothetical protein
LHFSQIGFTDERTFISGSSFPYLYPAKTRKKAQISPCPSKVSVGHFITASSIKQELSAD